jgi:hypothetical protein
MEKNSGYFLNIKALAAGAKSFRQLAVQSIVNQQYSQLAFFVNYFHLPLC